MLFGERAFEGLMFQPLPLSPRHRELPFHNLTVRHELSDRVERPMAQFAVRIYREKGGGYRGTIDGLGVVRGRSLAETVRSARVLLGEVLAGAFPDRLGIDPAGAALVIWFDIVLTRRNPGDVEQRVSGRDGGR